MKEVSNANQPLHRALERAIIEAQRFILKAKQAQKRLIDDKYAYLGSKEMGSAKRASMDLTRVLVKVRG